MFQHTVTSRTARAYLESLKATSKARKLLEQGQNTKTCQRKTLHNQAKFCQMVVGV